MSVCWGNCISLRIFSDYSCRWFLLHSNDTIIGFCQLLATVHKKSLLRFNSTAAASNVCEVPHPHPQFGCCFSLSMKHTCSNQRTANNLSRAHLVSPRTAHRLHPASLSMIIYALINEQRATSEAGDNCLLICKMLARKRHTCEYVFSSLNNNANNNRFGETKRDLFYYTYVETLREYGIETRLCNVTKQMALFQALSIVVQC
jgi:hypothetical protein